MKVPWSGNKCILCLQEDSLCEEHVIPESLGGRLTCNFLCRSCNSKLGHGLEATAKSDPSILLAARNLQSDIPSLSSTLIHSYPHIGHSDPGPAKGYIKNNEFRVLSRKLEDGSLIQPTDDARKSIIKILQKAGYNQLPIQKALASFDNAPEDNKIEIFPGLEIVKWSVQRLELDLNSAQTMDPLIPVKTAYEFLALHAGTVFYDDIPQLSQIRTSLTNMKLNSDVIRVERLSSNKYEPFHGICFEGNDPYAKIQIRLFGWLAFRVHFLRLSISGPRYVYSHRLDSNEEHIGLIMDSSNTIA